MTDLNSGDGRSDGRTTGRLLADVLAYTMARLALVAALTAVIFYGAHLIGIEEFPLVVAMLFNLFFINLVTVGLHSYAGVG